MGDMGEMFNGWREAKKEKRAQNTQSSTELLTEKGVQFVSKNGGAHLVVTGKDCVIDFWPSTGRFIARNGKHGRGVFNLLKLCEAK